MRHFRSILYALVLAPAVWVLTGAGLTRDLTTRGRTDFAVESVTGLLMLLLAGAAYGILIFAPISPAGPLVMGVAFLGVTLWALAAPSAYADVWPAAVAKDGFDLSRPGYGLAALLAVPMICTALSARRWAAYEPPVLPVIGRLGRARGAAPVAGTPAAELQTAVLPPAVPVGMDMGAEPTTVLRRGADDPTAMVRLGSGAGDDEPTVATVVSRDDPTTVVSAARPAGHDDPTTVVSAPPRAGHDDPTTIVPAAAAHGHDDPTTVVPTAVTAAHDEQAGVHDDPTTDVSVGEEPTVAAASGGAPTATPANPADDGEEVTADTTTGRKATFALTSDGVAIPMADTEPDRPAADERKPVHSGAESAPPAGEGESAAAAAEGGAESADDATQAIVADEDEATRAIRAGDAETAGAIATGEDGDDDRAAHAVIAGDEAAARAVTVGDSDAARAIAAGDEAAARTITVGEEEAARAVTSGDEAAARAVTAAAEPPGADETTEPVPAGAGGGSADSPDRGSEEETAALGGDPDGAASTGQSNASGRPESGEQSLPAGRLSLGERLRLSRQSDSDEQPSDRPAADERVGLGERLRLSADRTSDGQPEPAEQSAPAADQADASNRTAEDEATAPIESPASDAPATAEPGDAAAVPADGDASADNEPTTAGSTPVDSDEVTEPVSVIATKTTTTFGTGEEDDETAALDSVPVPGASKATDGDTTSVLDTDSTAGEANAAVEADDAPVATGADPAGATPISVEDDTSAPVAVATQGVEDTGTSVDDDERTVKGAAQPATDSATAADPTIESDVVGEDAGQSDERTFVGAAAVAVPEIPADLETTRPLSARDPETTRYLSPTDRERARLQALAAAEAARPAADSAPAAGSVATESVPAADPVPAAESAPAAGTSEDVETTRSLTAPDPDQTRVIWFQAEQTRSFTTSAPRPAPSVTAPNEHALPFDPDRTRSLTAPDPEQTQAIPLGDPNRARSLREADEHTQVIAFDPDQTRDLSGAMPDPDRTQIIRLHPPAAAGEPATQMLGPDGQTRNSPYPGTGDVGGDETQVIRLSSRPVRPSHVEPPGDRTEVFQVQTGSSTESRPGTPTSIAGAERPDFTEDPTSRIVPPGTRADDEPPAETPKRRRTVMDMERPPDEAADTPSQPDIPAQRRPSGDED